MDEPPPRHRPLPRLGALRSWAAARHRRLIASFVVLMHVLGALSSVRAVMSTRTPQGAIAWAISLNTFPYVAVPAYWVFGDARFGGYDLVRHRGFLERSETGARALEALRAGGLLYEPGSPELRQQVRLVERLAQLPMTRGNEVDLLVDGQATFDAIEAAIASAEDYVLFQFYILRADGLGERLKAALCERARAGVRCYVLYDGMGSKDLAPGYVDELRDAGVRVASFSTTEGWGNRLRYNFRNHRKVVVVDGREAFVGGHNVGDEYLGLDPEVGAFRDTHVALRGPAALAVQVSFLEDWRWVADETPELNWTPERAPGGDVVALCLPTGPADELETLELVMLDLIGAARERIWIATPYFVPDEQLVSALQLAALRGVDVRVIVPENNDNVLVDLTIHSYLVELERVGVRLFRYQPGFMHQKVFLIDGEVASVGTANFDNRSMRLNFEITMVLRDAGFAGQVEAMLLADLERSEPFPATAYSEGSLPFRFAVKAARLVAPVQ